MSIAQYVLTVAIGVVAVLLARETHVTSTDAGRLLLVAAIATLIVSIPVGLPIAMRLLSACLCGYALHSILDMALGPVPFKVLRRQPALLLASRGAYRMEFGVRRVAYS